MWMLQRYKSWFMQTNSIENQNGVTWWGQKGARGAYTPQYYFYLRIYLFFLLLIWKGTNKTAGRMGGKGCMCIKDWFNPIFPLFLTWILRKIPNMRDEFPPPPCY